MFHGNFVEQFVGFFGKTWEIFDRISAFHCGGRPIFVDSRILFRYTAICLELCRRLNIMIMSKKEIVQKQKEFQLALMNNIKSKLFVFRERQVLLDADVAAIYGVETRLVNMAVKNNPEKFQEGYMYRLDNKEIRNLRSKILIANLSPKSRTLPYVFTEKGLYMLATILKSPNATAATIAIVETFAAVRSLKHELVELHNETDQLVQQDKMKHFGEVLSDIVMPDLETSETESSLELNFIIGKLKHNVKRVKRR